MIFVGRRKYFKDFKTCILTNTLDSGKRFRDVVYFCKQGGIT